ncbi:MAG: phage late control D family protein [Candidatus Accumulibacter sp.]|uniref:Phage late control D family protein n=1 Tax=Candidatus Accumulibacter proximus TaxID=2954385 RepID=A0A935UGK6_9PROT|nr:phage late control D family protein [Candidatus Accumulibacter proximus]
MPSTNPNAPLLSVRPRLRIDGQDRANLGEAALTLELRLPRSGMASAELRLLNWSGAGGPPDFVFQDIRLGQRLDILLGEAATSAAFSGEITAIEEHYGSGAPQLVLLAEDALHKLARRRGSRAYENQSLDDVIRRIAGDAGLSADVQASSASTTWLQNNESDLAFLLRQLAPLDIGLRLHDGRLRARDEEADGNPVTLRPGEKAERIRIIADLNRQPTSVAVTGYDLSTAADVNAAGSALSPAPAGQSAAAVLGNLGWTSESTIPHPFARSQSEADALARKHFQRAARRFLYGEIVCRDTPELRSGREVELSDVSPRLAGRYRVVDCRHRFDGESGLRTHLHVQRPDWTV